MPDRTLRDCRILVVEDEFLPAEELQLALSDAAAVVLGPVAQLDQALAPAKTERRIDGAVLDVNLGGEPVHPLADLLLGRGVPIVLTTGYDAAALPPRFAGVVRREKPISIRLITQAIGRVVYS